MISLVENVNWNSVKKSKGQPKYLNRFIRFKLNLQMIVQLVSLIEVEKLKTWTRLTQLIKNWHVGVKVVVHRVLFSFIYKVNSMFQKLQHIYVIKLHITKRAPHLSTSVHDKVSTISCRAHLWMGPVGIKKTPSYLIVYVDGNSNHYPNYLIHHPK